MIPLIIECLHYSALQCTQCSARCTLFSTVLAEQYTVYCTIFLYVQWTGTYLLEQKYLIGERYFWCSPSFNRLIEVLANICSKTRFQCKHKEFSGFIKIHIRHSMSIKYLKKDVLGFCRNSMEQEQIKCLSHI